jgi:hypothetical protein
VLGAACAIEGDLLRLVGDLDNAEATYQRASGFGHDPEPGLALLRVAQGRLDAADAMIRRVLGEAEDPISRARLLGPYVEMRPEHVALELVFECGGSSCANRTIAPAPHALGGACHPLTG